MEHIFGRGDKGPQMPSRGAVAGVKADMERAKQGFNPNGVGMAWTHNFLNQKPWHPMNFRNRMKVWENEQDKVQADKTKEKAQAEFDAEQEYLKTLSYLSPAEQLRYREVQSVSFMYTKPPGYDAALARDAEAEKKKAAQPAPALEAPGGAGAAAAAGAGPPAPPDASAGPSGPAPPATQGQGPAQQAEQPPPPPQQQRAAMVDRLREDPYAAMLAARAALASNAKFALRQAEAGAYGGFRPDAANQQLLGEEAEAGASGAGGGDELDALLSLPPEQQLRALKRIAKRRRREEEERKLREAEEVLRAAGYDLGALAAGGGGGGGGGKHKKGKKSKSKGHKHKEKDADKPRKAKRRRDSDSGSGGSESESR